MKMYSMRTEIYKKLTLMTNEIVFLQETLPPIAEPTPGVPPPYTRV
uniref:Small hydrophobic protein n=1 Tax=Otomys rat paramyxovirus TaxID=3141898 RepID=A0AAU7E3S7_9MONO